MRDHITLLLSVSRQLISSSSHERYYSYKLAMALDICRVLPDLSWDCVCTPSSYDDDHHGFFAAMCVESPVSSEASSGYLDDAVFQWSDHCKRQRMAPLPLPRCPATVKEDLQCLLQKQRLWDSVSRDEGDLLDDSKMMVRGTSSFVSEQEDEDASGREQEQASAGAQMSAAQGEAGPPPPPRLLSDTEQLQQGAAAAVAHRPRPRPRQLQKATTGEPPRSRSNYGENELPSSTTSLAGKENTGYGVLWPFQFVKPMGLDGGGTAALKDVNRRILKRPARPVRHPVGRFACNAAVSYGVGLSGKAVVSLTRIRTGGKGTVTIIRTRG